VASNYLHSFSSRPVCALSQLAYYYRVLFTGIMKPFQLLASALAFIVADAYLVTPPGTVAPGAISTCSEWVQASYGMTCEIIHRLFGMTDTEFELWVSPYASCLGSYCYTQVLIRAEP
jgi:hypothetical protein